MRLQMIGGPLDGEPTYMLWPKIGDRREICWRSVHVYEVQYRLPAGRGGFVLRHVRSYRPATEPSER